MADLNLGDSTSRIGVDGYTAQFKSMSDPEFAAYEAGRKKEVELGKQAQGEATKRAQSQIMADYGSTLFSKPAPKFVPSQEDMSGFAALGSLLAVSGAMMGMKGKTSGIMAMNAISGMMKGYQQGRKDLYEQERQKFEASMKEWERERGQIKEAFDMALKMAPTNYKGATEFLNKTLAGMGVEVPRASLQRNGLTQTAASFGQALDKAGTTAKAIGAKTGYKMSPQEQIALSQEEARREAERKALGTGALEYGQIDGVKGMYSREQIVKAGPKFEPLAKPTSRTTKIQFEGKTVLADETGKPLRDPEGNVIAAPETARAGQQQFIAQRVVNSLGGAASAVEGLMALPAGTTTEVLPNLTTQDGLTNYFRNNIGRSLTSREADNMNTLFAGLGRNLATIESSGTATGLKALSDSLQSGVFINAGVDDPYKVALKVADIRRIAEENIQPIIDAKMLTPDQEKAASKLMERLKKAVPFTVIDVINAGNEAMATETGKPTTTIGEQTKGVVSGYKTADDVANAFKSGQISEQDARKILKEKFGIE